MRKLLIVAAVLWSTASVAQTVQNQPQIQGQVQLKQTPTRLQFVPPQELASKPNHPQASAASAYTGSITVEGINSVTKQKWSLIVPLRSYVIHAIVSPRDVASGMATGKRMHKPITITMETNAATPLIANLKRSDVISSFTFTFTPVTAGAAIHTFVIHDVVAPKLSQFAEYSEIAFTYQKITWTWIEGGKTASDDWEAPAA